MASEEVTTISGNTLLNLKESSEGITLEERGWAFEHDDSDTDVEPYHEPSWINPAVADQGGDDPAVADLAELDDGEPAVADVGDDVPAVADPQRDRRFAQPRPKVRPLPPARTSQKLYVQASPLQAFHLGDDSTTYGAASDIRRLTYEPHELPCLQYVHDVHIGTYILGTQAKPDQVAALLSNSGLEVTVLVFTGEVCRRHEIYEAVALWASVSQRCDGTHPPAQLADQESIAGLGDKRVVALGKHGDMFAALHMGRIRCAMFEERALSCSEVEDTAKDVHFGTLTVHLRKAEFDTDFVRIGLIVVRHRLTEMQIEGLSQWIILHRLLVLTGVIANAHDCRNYSERFFFGGLGETITSTEYDPRSPLTELAERSRAVGIRPLYQPINMDSAPNGEHIWVPPTPFMFFAYYDKVKKQAIAPRYYQHADMQTLQTVLLGDDMQNELMAIIQVPYWSNNFDGNAYAPHLGTIRLTEVDCSRWIDGCFMTVVRFGKSQCKRKRRRSDAHKEERRQLRRFRSSRRQSPRDDADTIYVARPWNDAEGEESEDATSPAPLRVPNWDRLLRPRNRG